LMLCAVIVPWRLIRPLDAPDPSSSDASRFSHAIPFPRVLLVAGAGGLAALGLAARSNVSPFGMFILAAGGAVSFFILSRSMVRAVTPPGRGKALSADWGVTVFFLPAAIFSVYALKLVFPNVRLGPWPALLAAGGVLAGLFRIILTRKTVIRIRIGDWAGRVPWRSLIVASIPFVLLTGATLAWGWHLRNQNIEQSLAAGGRPLAQVAAYSPTAPDILFPRHAEAERFIYPGAALAALAVWGAWASRRERKTVPLMALVAAAAVVLSFGPNLEPHLPFYRWLYDTVPIFHYPRVAGRMIHVAAVALAILAAFGVRAAIGRAWALAAVPLLIVMIDFAPAKVRGLALVPGPSVIYETVRKGLREKDGTVLALPIWPGDTAWSSLYQYEVTRSRFRMLNGYDPGVSRRYIREVFTPLYPMDFGEIREEQSAALRRFGVRYVVFHEEAYPRKVSPFPPKTALSRLMRSPALRFIREE
ncbi:MAG: hypothetical protein HYR98_08460, partial [Nitrospirae bacterium]|nr:hypothetical protein [Nitrospirota bacterium]